MKHTYIVCIVAETLCYGGPEEGGWWYTYSEPSDVPEHMRYMRVYRDEDKAYAYCRELNGGLIEQWNSEDFKYEFTSVLGGERWSATVFEDEMPHAEPTERPHYE